MARIPSAEQLGIRETRAITKGADTRGLRAAGRRATAMDLKSVETTAVQKGLKEMGETIANQELATAEVQFQIAAMAEAEKYKDDPDLDTIEERHAAGMTDQLGKASANITSAKGRAEFITRAEGGMAQANGTMNKRVTKRKNDREIAHFAGATDLLVKQGMDLEDGNPGDSAIAIQLGLDSMVERNVISAVDAGQTMRKAQLDMAYGRLKSMDPKQQLAILNSDDEATQKWLKDVPPDVLRQLRTQAESDELDNVAMGWAMEHRGEDNALDAMYEEAVAQNWDDERIQKTRLRIQRVATDDEAMKQKALNDYYEGGAAEIFAGTVTLAQMRSTPEGIEELKKLSQAQRENLERAEDNAIERAAGKGRKYSDRAVVDRLKAHMASGDIIGGRKYWSENYASLNDGDFKYFNVATSPTKSKAPEFDPIRSARQLLTEYKKQNDDMTDKQESDIWDRIDEKALTYFNENGGKKAPPAEVNAWVDEEFIKIKHTENWWPDEEKFLYEMDDTGKLQRDEVVAQIDFMQEATGLPRAEVGDLMAAYSSDHYEFVPKVNEALAHLRQSRPNDKPWQHWARIKQMLGIEKPALTVVGQQTPGSDAP